ncbi:hypothetical protein AGMMS49991_11790 [Spirochaetia bacterium]|nr:hypothetical protein AGMMS49991_11790 [Spirochaetia bacterium]
MSVNRWRYLIEAHAVLPSRGNTLAGAYVRAYFPRPEAFTANSSLCRAYAVL